ncbi:MAG: GAF domain-containing protein [Candidatus Eisenbacteria bacterium]|nr:GAF domain-containing protein [Candidatus Eisenbacteria bacterium]
MATTTANRWIESLAGMHEALDREELAFAFGRALESLAGGVPWRIELSGASGEASRTYAEGLGSVARLGATTTGRHLDDWIVVPLHFRDDVIGDLRVAAPEETEREDLDVLSDQLAAAMIKLQLWSDADRESRQSRLDREIIGEVHTLVGSFDMDYVLARSLEQILKLLGSEVGSVMLWDGRGFTTKYIIGLPEELTRAVRLEGRSAAERVAEAGVPLILEDPEPEDPPEGLEMLNLKTLLVMPLLSGGRVMGVLQAANPVDTWPGSHNLRAAEEIGHIAAIAVENAMLHREAVRKERMATIGQVMAGLSHDIKNMLQAVRSGYSLVRMGTDGGDLESVRRAVPLIGSAIDRISGLVLDMLDYSKGGRLRLAAVDMNALVREIAATMQPLAESKGVVLETAIDEGAPPARADQTGIFRCLSNLTTNAVEAVEAGGRVEIRTGRPAGGGGVEVVVRDDGPGIPEEERERIFDALYTTKGSKGTGLGLAVTRKIVEDHGGSITLESGRGRGACFTIRLPAAPGGVKER